MPERKFYTVRGYQLLNSGNKLLTPSMEDYLEMICRICEDEDYIRINQLSQRLNVRPSSATKIVQKLEALGMISYQRYGIIKLTETGREIGIFLLHRHAVLEKFFETISDDDVLLKDTEMIEHDISSNGLRCIQVLIEFFENNPAIKSRYDQFKQNCRFPASE